MKINLSYYGSSEHGWYREAADRISLCSHGVHAGFPNIKGIDYITVDIRTKNPKERDFKKVSFWPEPGCVSVFVSGERVEICHQRLLDFKGSHNLPNTVWARITPNSQPELGI
jgi:hypothetical protein